MCRQRYSKGGDDLRDVRVEGAQLQGWKSWGCLTSIGKSVTYFLAQIKRE